MLKNLDDSKKETKEYGRSNKDLVDRITTIQIEGSTERAKLNDKINKIKAEAETKEQISKDKLKDQIKITQSLSNGYESERKKNLKTIQETEDKNYELTNRLKTQEEYIRDLERKLEKKHESDQWSEQEKVIDSKPKT